MPLTIADLLTQLAMGQALPRPAVSPATPPVIGPTPIFPDFSPSTTPSTPPSVDPLSLYGIWKNTLGRDMPCARSPQPTYCGGFATPTMQPAMEALAAWGRSTPWLKQQGGAVGRMVGGATVVPPASEPMGGTDRPLEWIDPTTRRALDAIVDLLRAAGWVIGEGVTTVREDLADPLFRAARRRLAEERSLQTELERLETERRKQNDQPPLVGDKAIATAHEALRTKRSSAGADLVVPIVNSNTNGTGQSGKVEQPTGAAVRSTDELGDSDTDGDPAIDALEERIAYVNALAASTVLRSLDYVLRKEGLPEDARQHLIVVIGRVAREEAQQAVLLSLCTAVRQLRYEGHLQWSGSQLGKILLAVARCGFQKDINRYQLLEVVQAVPDVDIQVALIVALFEASPYSGDVPLTTVANLYRLVAAWVKRNPWLRRVGGEPGPSVVETWVHPLITNAGADLDDVHRLMWVLHNHGVGLKTAYELMTTICRRLEGEARRDFLQCVGNAVRVIDMAPLRDQVVAMSSYVEFWTWVVREYPCYAKRIVMRMAKLFGTYESCPMRMEDVWERTCKDVVRLIADIPATLGQLTRAYWVDEARKILELRRHFFDEEGAGAVLSTEQMGTVFPGRDAMVSEQGTYLAIMGRDLRGHVPTEWRGAVMEADFMHCIRRAAPAAVDPEGHVAQIIHAIRDGSQYVLPFAEVAARLARVVQSAGAKERFEAELALAAAMAGQVHLSTENVQSLGQWVGDHRTLAHVERLLSQRFPAIVERLVRAPQAPAPETHPPAAGAGSAAPAVARGPTFDEVPTVVAHLLPILKQLSDQQRRALLECSDTEFFRRLYLYVEQSPIDPKDPTRSWYRLWPVTIRPRLRAALTEALRVAADRAVAGVAASNPLATGPALFSSLLAHVRQGLAQFAVLKGSTLHLRIQPMKGSGLALMAWDALAPALLPFDKLTLWQDPQTIPWVIVDHDMWEPVGIFFTRERTISGKTYCHLFSIHLFDQSLSEMTDAETLYRFLMGVVESWATERGFAGVVIPSAPEVLRDSRLRDIVARCHYPRLDATDATTHSNLVDAADHFYLVSE